MARSNFGGSDTGALAIQAPACNSGVVKSAPLVTTGTAWSAASGGTQYTDMLLVGGGASVYVLTDSNGFVRAFQGPDGVNEGLWVDLGSGRFYLRTTDALSSAYVSKVAPPTGVSATDTAAITAAIAALPSTGGELRFPAGSYVTTGGFTLTVPTAVIGCGMAGMGNGEGAGSLAAGTEITCTSRNR